MHKGLSHNRFYIAVSASGHGRRACRARGDGQDGDDQGPGPRPWNDGLRVQLL